MFKRISCIFAIALLFISLIAVPLNTNAYISSDNLYRSFNPVSSELKFSPSYDGVYLIHTLYKSYYSPDTINSPAMLNNSYFGSGIWNGQDVSGLDSRYIYDIDVAGFSQSVSYSDKGDYFIYSMITCLPVKAGDNFSLRCASNTTNVRETGGHFFLHTFLVVQDVK